MTEFRIPEHHLLQSFWHLVEQKTPTPEERTPHLFAVLF
jgi:hypothetical protein